MVNTGTQKRKRYGILAIRMPASRSTSRSTPSAMIGESAAPLPQAGDDESLALERVMEKVAAGEGEEAGMKAKELSALCLRQMKLVREKNEIEKAVAIMNISLMQAAHSSEQRKMAESLNLRKLVIMALDCEKEELEAAEDRTASYVLKVQAEQQDLQARNHNLLCQNDHLNRENHMMRGSLCAKDMELMHSARAIAQLQGESATLKTEVVKLQGECVTMRSELGRLETEHQKQVACSNFDSDVMRRLRTTANGYLKASLAFSKYLQKKMARHPGVMTRLGNYWRTLKFTGLHIQHFVKVAAQTSGSIG